MKLVTLALVLAACGGGNKPSTTTTTTQTAETGGHDPQHMMMMEKIKSSPELSKFHDVLMPRWHADKGPKRMADTCGAIADFQANAAPIANQPLTDAVTALEATCKANDAAAFEPAFDKVHTAFHAVMEASGTGHEEHEHGEHGEHGGHGG